MHAPLEDKNPVNQPPFPSQYRTIKSDNPMPQMPLMLFTETTKLVDILYNRQIVSALPQEISLSFLDHSIQPLFNRSVSTNNVNGKPGSIFSIQQ